MAGPENMVRWSARGCGFRCGCLFCCFRFCRSPKNSAVVSVSVVIRAIGVIRGSHPFCFDAPRLICYARDMHFRWVFLDAGNTLVTIDFEFVRDLLAEHGVVTDVASLERAEFQARRVVDQPQIVRVTSDRVRWSPFFQALLIGVGAHDASLCARVLPALEARQRSHNLWRRVVPEVPETLSALLVSGRRLAVISNSDGRLDYLLRDVGLRDYFEFVVDSGRVGCEKPDPQIFRIALNQAGLAPEEAVYCGDLLHVDIAGANAAGIPAVLLDPAGTHPNATCPRIGSIAELPALLGHWPNERPNATKIL